ncbi:hypothetical protein ZIOFF_015460 [Zingiber officinale]|uniref:Uncharacterized protein n=1 Tax=Zingiber officinale TaxID=94328 RepID=A0A8J5HR82_ZINOF|nr:hypothetical protein ZIOFF_015460 [Zingiber officinale]
MADSLPPNAGPNFPSFLLPPRPPTLPASPPPPPPPPLPSQPPPPSSAPGHESLPIAGGHSFSLRRPAVRVTSEFDSDRSVFFHKISCKLFDSLAKLKLTFQNDRNGVIAYPQIGFITKHFAALYDLESRNALLKGFFDIGDALRVRATHDTKEQQGEIAIITNLFNPSYKLEVASPVPSVGLFADIFEIDELINYKLHLQPRATVCFPLGEVSVEEKKDQEAEKVLSISGVLKGYLMNGVCTALYQNEELNLSYRYKVAPDVFRSPGSKSFFLHRKISPQVYSNIWTTIVATSKHKAISPLGLHLVIKTTLDPRRMKHSSPLCVKKSRLAYLSRTSKSYFAKCLLQLLADLLRLSLLLMSVTFGHRVKSTYLSDV